MVDSVARQVLSRRMEGKLIMEKPSAATQQVRAYWNGVEILNGKCSRAMACQIICSMQDEFAGSSHQACELEASRVAASFLNSGIGAATHFLFSDETGSAEVCVNF